MEKATRFLFQNGLRTVAMASIRPTIWKWQLSWGQIHLNILPQDLVINKCHLLRWGRKVQKGFCSMWTVNPLTSSDIFAPFWASWPDQKHEPLFDFFQFLVPIIFESSKDQWTCSLFMILFLSTAFRRIKFQISHSISTPLASKVAHWRNILGKSDGGKFSKNKHNLPVTRKWAILVW